MTTLKLGENVMFEDDGGHWRKGQVWSLHSEAHWFWIVCEGRMYARKRSGLNSMREKSETPSLFDSISATSDMRTQHTQEALV